jgi:glycosyltransferase 2 family protein
MEHHSPTLRPRIPRWLLQVAVYGLSVGSLAWVLHDYPIGELIPSIRSLDFRWVALAVACDLSVYVIHGWRWNTLLGPVIRLRLWRTVQAIYIGLFANEVLPLRVGELMRAYLLCHWNDLRISLGFASIAVERLFDGLWMLAAFLITAAFVKRIPRDLTILVQILGALLVLGAVLLIWVVMWKHEAHAAVAESRWAATLRHIIEGLHLMGNPSTMSWTALISLLYLAVNVMFMYALMKAYGLDLSFWVAGGVLAIVRFSTVVPNAPGNAGLTQFACVVALQLFEVEKNDAKTFSFIMFFVQTLPLLIGGAVATALTGVNLGELHKRARRSVSDVHPEPATEEP